MKNLVIVESPAKAKTIEGYLGKDYRVLSSYGHVRDLPKTKLGVDPENDFKPKYRLMPRSKSQVNKIKKAFKKANSLYLATDLDREGEAIAWHLVEALGLDKKNKQVRRITFDQITKSAIKKAIAKPRDIDMDLVDAQQARRILDRLVGYKLSPLLWKKITRGLSAGRVQSVAVRLVVERERKIEKFKPQKYFQIKAELTDGQKKFEASLYKIKDKKIGKLDIKSKKEADKIKNDLAEDIWKVIDLEKKTKAKNPYPPYNTASLQRDAAYRLNFSAKKSMFLAQKLYEGVSIEGKNQGLITYMRTDSFNLADEAIDKARTYIKENYSSDLPEKARRFKSKSKGAQEAHEAVRPTDPTKDPQSIKKYLELDQFKLYQLIWQRMIASQMKSIKYNAVKAIIKVGDYQFVAKGRTIVDPAFSKIYSVSLKEAVIPELKKDQELNLLKLISKEKETQPPSRYSESALVKELEKRGIGRPSTYAPTISTIQDRNYIEKLEGYFHPTEIGVVVNDFLVKYFPKVMDYEFTAEMESKLDDIAKGSKQWQKVIKDFYQPFESNLESVGEKIKKEDISEQKLGEKCPKCKGDLVKKMGRFGSFVACSNYPDCKYSRPLKNNEGSLGKRPKQKKNELSEEEKKRAEKVLAKNQKCPKCNSKMEIKKGRFGVFLGCSNYPECKYLIPVPEKTGQKCPDCGGDIVVKRTRRGKKFWGCSNYPKCDWASWQDPSRKS
jgi:DNA topoisomerase-1